MIFSKTSKALTSSVLLGACLLVLTPTAAFAQTIQTQDISVQLQTSLEASAPTLIYFDFDKDAITSEAAAILEQQAVWLSQNPEAKVDLAGHTDSVGASEYNDDLAMRRANAVNNFLLARGVSQNQMRSVVSRGERELAIPTQRRERLNRCVTTSVTGLVQLVVTAPSPQAPIPPAPIPQVRQYADPSVPICDGRSRDSLLALGDEDLMSALTDRMNSAAEKYSNPIVQASVSMEFNQAAFTKVQCGIAIGFLKKNHYDERSISNCSC